MRDHPPAARSAVRLAHSQAGVTLIELIVVITISGIIATMLAYFIVGPVEDYRSQVRHAQLVDAAEMAIRRMARDIRQALPNSVRVDPTGHAIEMLNTLDGARYRDGPGQGPLGTYYTTTSSWLTFSGADTDGFNIVGSFQNVTLPFAWNNAACPSGAGGCRLAIYNQGVPGADAYTDGASSSCGATPCVITNPSNTQFTISPPSGGSDEDHVTTSGNLWFRLRSPYQRVYIVNTPITYLCNPGPTGTIYRYWGYPITQTQPTDPTVSPLSGVTPALVTTPVTACTFTYQPGTATRAGLVTIDITLGDVESGDRIRLLYQVHVDNSP